MEMEPHNDSMCFSSKMYKPEEAHLALWVLFPGKITSPTHLIVKLSYHLINNLKALLFI